MALVISYEEYVWRVVNYQMLLEKSPLPAELSQKWVDRYTMQLLQMNLPYSSSSSGTAMTTRSLDLRVYEGNQLFSYEPPSYVLPYLAKAALPVAQDSIKQRFSDFSYYEPPLYVEAAQDPIKQRFSNLDWE